MNTNNKMSLYNSLTLGIDALPEKKELTWYSCGPTVYDKAHLGHARNYLTFDIMRRVLEIHFGYRINMVMNITDIDDKIIDRTKLVFPDKELSNKDFLAYASNFENEFRDDMRKLGVMEPDTITRVSEFIPEIIQYIEQIIKNGFAYVSNGSVYFDSQAFKKAGFNFAPFHQHGDDTFDNEVVHTSEKKCIQDFALWKASDKDIFFDSPWGTGRPGWHIECSTMASAILGNQIDIHSGGIDLAFPHHNNEILQATAHNLEEGWINFFLHSGHLNIAGLKMSKSLKNFITIDDFLENKGTPRQLRLFFLTHKWNRSLDYSDEILEQITIMDKRFVDFFGNTMFFIRQNQDTPEVDDRFDEIVDKTREDIDKALRDNLDTQKVMKLLLTLVNVINAYILNKKVINVEYVKMGYNLIMGTLQMFGLDFSANIDTDEDVTPWIDAIVSFRDEIKKVVSDKNVPKEFKKRIFQLTDKLRDETILELGVQLEDRPGQSTLWKFV